jgi:hypothetical protein
VRRPRTERLQGHNNRIRLVILCGAGGGVHAHPDQTAGQKVACKASRPSAGNLLREWNNLRLIPIFVHCNGNVGVSLRHNHARGHAGRRNFKS